MMGLGRNLANESTVAPDWILEGRKEDGKSDKFHPSTLRDSEQVVVTFPLLAN
jgi:hypothetical protein